ncbi:ATP-binding cassette domain-containing protein [[Mycoplasma] collis]|uniref:ATP-binding cassette domain-containing protein n=1 Tax=[Mycoplasma] collis TaxID=2127 RepID=UPI00051B3D88|nr:ABC transporter ATP-binding protein [[Mycoplasma] collis]
MKLIFRHNKFKLFIFQISVILMTILPIIILYLESLFINYVIDKTGVNDKDAIIKILIISAILIIFYIFNLIFNYFYYRLTLFQMLFVYKIIIKDLVNQISDSKNLETMKFNQNIFIEKTINEGNQYYNLNYIAWMEMLANSLVIFTVLIYWGVTNYYILIILLFIIFLYLVFNFIFQKKNTNYLNKFKNKYNILLNSINNFFDNFHTLYFSNKTDLLFEKNKKIINKTFNLERKKKNWSFFTDYSQNIIFLFFQNLTIILMVYFYLENIFDISIGTIFLFHYSIGKFKDSIENTFENFKNVLSTRNLVNSFNLSLEKDLNTKSIDEINKIELKNINLKFNDKNIFTNLNLKFEKGKKYAIVGKSGSGKSTLFKLLTSKINNYEGDIFISDTNIKNINNLNLRKKITIFENKSYIFETNLKENISLFDDNINDAELEKSVELSNISNNILETNDLSQLSTGEKQRVNIARIFYLKKNFLLLDEVLANLDEKNADEILKNLLNTNSTILYISHHLRKEQMQMFDEVINFNLF